MNEEAREETTTATVYRQFADMGDDTSWWIEDRPVKKSPETTTTV